MAERTDRLYFDDFTTVLSVLFVCLFVCLNYKGDTEVVEMTCVEYTVEGIAMRTESNERRKQSIVFRCSMNTMFSYQIDISSSTLSLITIK